MGDSELRPSANASSFSLELRRQCDLASPSMHVLKKVRPCADLSMNVEPSESSLNVEEDTEESKSTTRKNDNVSLTNENKNMSSTVSIRKTPASTVHQNTSTPSGKTSSANAIIQQGATSSKPNPLRNPVTGVGVTSSDEFTNEPSKRKDGNPVLGVGYKDETSRNKSKKIPPGGHSNGLW